MNTPEKLSPERLAKIRAIGRLGDWPPPTTLEVLDLLPALLAHIAAVEAELDKLVEKYNRLQDALVRSPEHWREPGERLMDSQVSVWSHLTKNDPEFLASHERGKEAAEQGEFIEVDWSSPTIRKEAHDGE
jgi:hypothetical protein